MSSTILFSESESYYRKLGLKDIDGIFFIFDGMRFYKRRDSFLMTFSVFISIFYTMPHNILLTQRFKKLGIKTVLCSDGINDLANSFINPMHIKYGVELLHPILQDFFLCVGKREKIYFNQSAVAMDFMPNTIITKQYPIPPPESRKILITTANTAYFNDDEFELLLKLIVGVSELLGDKGVDFSFRIFDDKLFSALQENYSGSIVNDIQSGFEDTLERYTSVITTPSSIAVASMFHGRPTALLIYRDWPMFLQTGWSIPSVDVFKNNFDSFFDCDDSRIAIQDRLFLNYRTTKGITDRINDILNIKLLKSHDCDNLIIRSYENFLLSKFNFNFEWFVRRVYLRLKRVKFFSNFINKMKKNTL